MTKDEALTLALEALEANDLLINGTEKAGGLAWCIDGYYSDCFDIDPINEQTERAITAIKEVLAQSVSSHGNAEDLYVEMSKHLNCPHCGGSGHIDDVAQSEQEPVAWGVDWGKAGDIPCVSIIKRVPNGGIEVMAVEYAPYSYTTPPQPEQEPVAWRKREIGGGWQYYGWKETGMTYESVKRINKNGFECEAIPATPPQRSKLSGKPSAWVGLTDEDVHDCLKGLPTQSIKVYAKSIEAKLKQKNGYEEKNT